jgi:hypothetical protein
MFFHTNCRRAQTATEYLIIAAVVIILAVLVVTILGDTVNIGGANDRGDLLAYRTRDIGVTDFSWHGGSVLMTIQNNKGGIIDIDYININNKFCAMTNFDYLYQTVYHARDCSAPYSANCTAGLNGTRLLEPEIGSFLSMVRLNPGQSRTFRCFNMQDVRPNDRYSADIKIKYTEVATGSSFILDNPGLQIKGRGAIPTYDNSTVLVDYLINNDYVINSNYFGRSNAISADGEYIASSSSSRQAVYVFKNSGSTWNQQAKLVRSSGSSTSTFGMGYANAKAVAISNDGTVIAVGDYGQNSSRGSVYIFRRTDTNWAQEVVLTASDVSSQYYFGSSLDISGDGTRLVVSAISWHNNYRGKVYFFRYTGSSWVEEQSVTLASPVDSDHFGMGLALNGDGSLAVIGAIGRDYSGFTNRGAAYIYGRSGTTWSLLQNITPSLAVNFLQFGGTLDISDDGEYIVGGTYSYWNGAAFLFRKQGQTWSQSQLLNVPTSSPNSARFGEQVSISPDGSKLFVSMPYSTIWDVGCYYSGKGYIYSKQGNTFVYRAMVGNNRIYTSNCAAPTNIYNYYGEHPIAISNNGLSVLSSIRTNTIYNNPSASSYVGSVAVYGYSGR